jgi:hypothetical protein
MTIGETLTQEQRLTEQVNQLRLQVVNLSSELSFFRDENKTPGWLQSKVLRQAKALTSLNKRVRMQRLILRELNEINPELADTIFNVVKDKYSTELSDDVVLTF